MGGSANESVQVVIRNAEVNINSVKDILREVFENVLSHLNVDVAFHLILTSAVADLNPCRVKRCVRVLITGHKDDVSEPAQPFHFTNLVQAARFHVVIDCV